MSEPSLLDDQGFARPIPPADSIPAAVRALNSILSNMRGAEPIAALARGDATEVIDSSLWAPAWEGARTFREIFLVTLARQTRDEWARDIKDIVTNQPSFLRAGLIAKALDARLRVTLEFAFRYLAQRHICLLADVLTLAFSSAEMSGDEFRNELIASASRCKAATADQLDAVLVGASGMHMYQPERVLSSSMSISR